MSVPLYILLEDEVNNKLEKIIERYSSVTQATKKDIIVKLINDEYSRK